MTELIPWNRWRFWFKGAAVGLLMAVTLAGCGSIGGGDKHPTTAPTPTVWPTVAAANTAVAPLVGPPSSPNTVTSPVSATSTPDLAGGTRMGSPAASQTSGATPAPAETKIATSSALGAPSGAATPSAATPAGATPAVATPAAGTPRAPGSPATPAAGTPIANVVVTSCDPDTIPPFTGKDPDYVTTTDVNFRSGPGSDCDVVGDVLSQGVTVTVLSDPVTRKGDDSRWVQVNVDGDLGWVSFDFLEPASGQ